MRKPILPKQSFRIQHLDRFFQGVSKDNEKISFIKRALPEEIGIASIGKTKKGVQFAIISEITLKSKDRSIPECPHYQECSGCHCLHLDYQKELNYKNITFKRFLEKYIHKPIELLKLDRKSYRNRVQLHYKKGSKKLGFRAFNDPKKIINVPECEIMMPKVKSSYMELLKNSSKAKKHDGHIEIYQYQKKVYINENQPYAHQGFTQVNSKLNQELLKKIEQIVIKHKLDQENSLCLDLFGGDGNLSSSIQLSKTIIVDNSLKELPNYIKLNLYPEESITELKKNLKWSSSTHLMIINPPRQGFKHINRYLSEFQPNYLLYMSCDIATMKRDLDSIQAKFECIENWLIDFFPGTYHFESLLLLKFFK